MPKQTRYAIKQFLENAENNLYRATQQLLAVSDIYKSNDAPEYAEPIDATIYALSEIIELLQERRQAA